MSDVGTILALMLLGLAAVGFIAYALQGVAL